MAESVDALVSNTNDSNVVPVRPRLRVPIKNPKWLIHSCLGFLFYPPCPHFVRIFPTRAVSMLGLSVWRSFYFVNFFFSPPLSDVSRMDLVSLLSGV